MAHTVKVSLEVVKRYDNFTQNQLWSVLNHLWSASHVH